MNTKNKQKEVDNVDVAEYRSNNKKNVNFSVEPANTKPYDISLMTGDVQNDTSEGDE